MDRNADSDLAGISSLDAIAFAVRWMRCGGGAAGDIASRFGCSAPEFFRVLERQLDDPPAPLRPDVVAALGAVARRRQWLAT